MQAIVSASTNATARPLTHPPRMLFPLRSCIRMNTSLMPLTEADPVAMAEQTLTMTATKEHATEPPSVRLPQPEIGPLSTHAAAIVNATTLIDATAGFVKQYMSQPPFDVSHDYTHIERVLRLCTILRLDYEAEHATALDSTLITLTALLHDVGDHKYKPADGTPAPTAQSILLSFSCPPELAAKVDLLTAHVSCTYELAHMDLVDELVRAHPELAIVQDADRLDAIGARGIARAFAYGGAKGRCLDHTVPVVGDKLMGREAMMRTRAGKHMANERCRRLRDFLGWWDEEVV